MAFIEEFRKELSFDEQVEKVKAAASDLGQDNSKDNDQIAKRKIRSTSIEAQIEALREIEREPEDLLLSAGGKELAGMLAVNLNSEFERLHYWQEWKLQPNQGVETSERNIRNFPLSVHDARRKLLSAELGSHASQMVEQSLVIAELHVNNAQGEFD